MKRLIKRRNLLWARFKLTQNQDHFVIFKRARYNVVSLNRRLFANYSSEIHESLTGNNASIKKFWQFSNIMMGKKMLSEIPPLNHQDTLVCDPLAKAEIFIDYFSKQHMLPDGATEDALPAFTYLTEQRMPDFRITPHEVGLIIQSLDEKKATGYDCISNKMLKMTVPHICQPLSLLFNKYLFSGTFPSEWKKANVSPIFKKGDRQLISNYRPISLLSNVSKVFERAVFNKLYSYLTTNNLLTSKNAGYKKNESTVSQLLMICHKIHQGLENRMHVRMTFLDASKAFDRVWHLGLIFKLNQLGIQGTFLQLIRSYISDRCQKVVLSGFSSTWTSVRAGVPQGSILGPLLFLVYTNDIINNIQTDINLNADDTSLLSISPDPVSCARNLNGDLEILNMWAKRWFVSFNVTKTVSMTFSKYDICPPLYMDGMQIKEVTSHCHLGHSGIR